MQIFQVPKFRNGYTFIELLVVIVIIGLFFYLTFPVVRDIIPQEENKTISTIVDIIEEASRDAIEQKQKVILTIDMDTNSYAITKESDIEQENIEENDYNDKEDISFTQVPIDFIKAQNSMLETSTGLITFLFFPDGTKEFGAIFVEYVETGAIYTIFLNPYTISPEIIKGEKRFE
ncbi:MAG: type II secretion system GspH family protein [bacterium]|nr:type II secretion system GspH family protein [bacterium]